MNKRILFILILLVFILIGTVSAETLSGNLGTGEGWLSENYQISYSVRMASVNHLNYITWNDQENGQGFKSLIHWPGTPQWLGTDVGAPNGASTTFTAYKWNTTSGAPTDIVIGTGSIGYQRAYLYNGQESGSYVWILFDDAIFTSYTGDTSWYIDYNRNAIYNATLSYYPTSGITPQSGKCGWGPGASSTSYDGQYTMNKDLQFHNSYTVTKPLGLGIAGSVIKSYSGTTYQSRVFIINATDGAIISSEGSVNPTTYNFTNNKEIIRICVLSSNATWFNTTDLFTAGQGAAPTPTPTPTVTGTYTEADYSTITLTIKNNQNSSVVSGAQVQLFRHDPNNFVDTAYSDSNGVVTFSNVPIHTYPSQEVKVVKRGYQITNEWITISPYYYSKTVYLNPSVGGNPSYPENINLTLTVRNSNGGAVVPNAYVTAFDAQAQLSGAAGYTDGNGIVTFNHFANTPYIEGVASKSGFYDKAWFKEPLGELGQGDYSGTIYITSISGGGGPTPTVTPTVTPVQYDTWSLSANPNSIPLGESSLLLLDCSNETKEEAAGGLRTVLYYERTNLGPSSNWKLIGVYKYNVSQDDWDFRVDNYQAWNYGGYDPTELQVTPGTAGDYDYQAAVFGPNSASWGTAETGLLIGGGGNLGSLTMSISAMDGSTMNHLQNYQLTLTDDVTDTTVDYGTIQYDKEVNLPRGATYTATATKTGYETNTKTFVVPIDPNIEAGDFGAIVSVLLFPPGVISVGNTTVTVMVDDAETYYPVGSVQISITGQQPKFTGPAGEGVSFILSQNTAYTVNAAKAGYCGASEVFNTSTNTYKYIPLYIKYGSCVGPTPTHTPIPNATPIVTTPTPIGGYGQINGTAAVCGELPEDASFIDVLRNNLACNGFKDVLSQNMALAMLIILAAGIILGRVAGGVGVLSGVVAGTVISMAMGFLPFWIIIVVIIIAGLIFAGKVFWSGGT